MSQNNYTSTITVKQSPADVYKAVADFRAWWSLSIEGETNQVNALFFYHYKEVHLCKLKLIEAIPNKRLVYEVVENEFNFVKDKTEWVGTKLVFDIGSKNDSTTLVFTHQGLISEYECYEICKDAWSSYIQGSLKNLIETGIGNPNPAEGGLNEELVKKWGLPNK